MSQEVNTTQTARPFLTLLIENDDDDVFVFRRALVAAGYTGEVRVVGSATEARSYLENTGAYKDAHYYPRPSFMVSDYRLAGHTAMEFLTWLKGDARFSRIPIVIISGAVQDSAKQQLQSMGATGFLAKTGNVAELAAKLKPFFGL